MDATTQSDMALLRRYASVGDAAAVAELIRRYAGMVFGVAQRITRDPHDAEDVAQSCFLELLRRAGELPAAAGGGEASSAIAESDGSETSGGAAGSAAGWIHTTAVHRALDVLRNKATRRRH